MWLITDEGTLAEFFDPVEDAEVLATMVKLERFDDRHALDAALDDIA